MMWLKACTRCQGDLIEGMDLDGPVVQCLQCGRSGTRPRHDRALSRSQPARRRRTRPPVDSWMAQDMNAGDLGPMIGAQDAGGDAWAS